MPDFLMLMHGDAAAPVDPSAWGPYLARLEAAGQLRGGSAVGPGLCVRKSGSPGPLSAEITGFIRVAADSLEHARALVDGNPVYEHGGTVEIRALPVTA